MLKQKKIHVLYEVVEHGLHVCLELQDGVIAGEGGVLEGDVADGQPAHSEVALALQLERVHYDPVLEDLEGVALVRQPAPARL